MFSLYMLSEFFSNVKDRCLGHEKVNVEKIIHINDYIYIYWFMALNLFLSTNNLSYASQF